MQVVDGRRLESKVHVEGPRGIVFGVGEQGANANNIGGLCRPQNRILEQSAAKATALLAGVYRQSRKRMTGTGYRPKPSATRRGVSSRPTEPAAKV